MRKYMDEADLVCPECGGKKYRYSKKCRKCYAKNKVKSDNSRWSRGKAKNPNYGKVLCPECGVNYKTRHSEVCLQCDRSRRLSGRIGAQYCFRCKTKLTDDNWLPGNRRYWTRICSDCLKKDHDRRRKSINAHQKIAIGELKDEMIKAYGGKCICCGETEKAFLTIDHINGRGKEHRAFVTGSDGKKSYRMSGAVLYGWLRKHGWPKDNYQLLCMNCNFAKSHNPGGCPHEIARQKKAKKKA